MLRDGWPILALRCGHVIEGHFLRFYANALFEIQSYSGLCRHFLRCEWISEVFGISWIRWMCSLPAPSYHCTEKWYVIIKRSGPPNQPTSLWMICVCGETYIFFYKTHQSTCFLNIPACSAWDKGRDLLFKCTNLFYILFVDKKTVCKILKSCLWVVDVIFPMHCGVVLSHIFVPRLLFHRLVPPT